jgi:hypothetical protein
MIALARVAGGAGGRDGAGLHLELLDILAQPPAGDRLGNVGKGGLVEGAVVGSRLGRRDGRRRLGEDEGRSRSGEPASAEAMAALSSRCRTGLAT